MKERTNLRGQHSEIRERDICLKDQGKIKTEIISSCREEKASWGGGDVYQE